MYMLYLIRYSSASLSLSTKKSLKKSYCFWISYHPDNLGQRLRMETGRGKKQCPHILIGKPQFMSFTVASKISLTRLWK